MAKFRGLPVNYSPVIQVDSQGSPIPDQGKHILNAGWLQSFSDLNTVLSGQWIKDQYGSWTPWVGSLYYVAPATGPMTIKSPIKYVGIITRYSSALNVLSHHLFDGDSIAISLTQGDIVQGTVVPK